MSVKNPLPTHRRAKRLLLGALLLLLLLPPLQARLHWLPEATLGGAFTLAEHPQLSLASLRDNTYQPALEKYLEDRLGFRNFLVRSHNQLLYSLLGITHHPEILIGKNNVLFMAPYIRAYLGEDRLDTATVRHRVLRLRVMQQDLARRGISFLFVLAPSKARFEPENLPDHPAPAAVTNYDLFVRQMQAEGINLLDCVALFARWKPTSPYPLYPRGGTHWSGYGATRVADSLLHRLEALGGYQLPGFREVGRPTIVYHSDSLRSTDNDLNVAFNLLVRQETTPLAYRHIRFDPPRPGQVQPSLLLVSDSYCWGLMQFSPYLQRAFAPDSRVWFYNKEVYAPDTVATKIGEVKDLNLQQEVEKRRTIVLMMTDFNLPEHEFWFTDNLYGLYHPFTDADYYAVDQLAAKIKAANGPGIQHSKPEQLTQRAHDLALQEYDTQRLRRILAAGN